MIPFENLLPTINNNFKAFYLNVFSFKAAKALPKHQLYTLHRLDTSKIMHFSANTITHTRRSKSADDTFEAGIPERSTCWPYGEMRRSASTSTCTPKVGPTTTRGLQSLQRRWLDAGPWRVASNGGASDRRHFICCRPWPAMNQEMRIFSIWRRRPQVDQIRISTVVRESILSCPTARSPAGDHQLPHLSPSATASFCARIFGPIRTTRPVRQVQADEWRGIICDASVEVTLSARPARAYGLYRARRACRPHLVPEVAGSRIGLLLDMRRWSDPRAHPVLLNITSCSSWPDRAGSDRQLLPEDEYLGAQDEYGQDPSPPWSAPRRSAKCSWSSTREASSATLRAEDAGDRPEIVSTSSRSSVLKIVEAFPPFRQQAGVDDPRPSCRWSRLTWRPLVLLDGGRFCDVRTSTTSTAASSTATTAWSGWWTECAWTSSSATKSACCRKRSTRCLDNGSLRAASSLAPTSVRLSRSPICWRAQGRFRQNLLGKRVDYSGRSVIVVGPELSCTSVACRRRWRSSCSSRSSILRLDAKGPSTTVCRPRSWSRSERPEVWRHPGRGSSASIRCCSTARRRCIVPASRPSAARWRGQGDPAAPAGLRCLQRRLRRRSQMACTVPLVAGSPARSACWMCRLTTSCIRRTGQPIIMCCRRTSCSALTTSRSCVKACLARARSSATRPSSRHHAAAEGHPPTARSSVSLESSDEEGKLVKRVDRNHRRPRRARQSLPVRSAWRCRYDDRSTSSMTSANPRASSIRSHRHCGQKEIVIFCDRHHGAPAHNAFGGIRFGAARTTMVVPHGVGRSSTPPRAGEDFGAAVQRRPRSTLWREVQHRSSIAWSKATEEIARRDDEGDFVDQEDA